MAANSTDDMYADARAARDHLRLEKIARRAVESAPSLTYEDYPREVSKRAISVDEAAQRIANALHLHLD
ncbi:hypothetical protein ISU10_14535 [Nocardioides agariphilus]|jgi:hypothetical protein|uniref:Uncharacterized protein n=1 Tax=Nocardioides agariphilus TaxID=433664 RepID=A0A930VQF9_9ACTN|nr:hypothetical protein [Nocardioides agariphilus]MBF4768981.1 hypothetical protein [Nocardioides agariphilus]